MPLPRSKPRNGLNEIRTMSGFVTETDKPHRRFLKLAVLAMERARRGKERDSARQRIEDIDGRFAEIEAESGILLQQALESAEGRAQEKRPAAGRASPSATSSNPPRPAPLRAPGGHKLKY